MEKKTGILLITSDRLGMSPDAGAPTTETKCETLDSCMKRLRNYMQEVTTYHPMGLWADESGALVTQDGACEMTQCRYESYDRLACKNMVQYIFTYRVATGEPLAIVTMIFNDFYKV